MNVTKLEVDLKKKTISDTILEFGVGSNEDLIEEELDNNFHQEDQGIFHTPFFFEQ